MNPLRAKLVLSDGTVFEGRSFGYVASTSGEVVFNTGMVGYTESLTDPSYAGQILCLTYPLVGNYGVPEKIVENALIKNFESHKIQVQALVVNYYSSEYSHHEAKKSLGEWLNEEKIPAIEGIDVRSLTKILREKGTMLGKIIIDEKDTELYDPNLENLVENVSIHKPIVYGKSGKKVLLIDCGAKNNIIHSLLARKAQVIRVPWDFDFFSKEFEHDFDGIIISNGPGDPKMCIPTIENIRRAMEKEIPTFGICLGNQLLALASGADTYKLKYGHRGQNQPAYIVGEQPFRRFRSLERLNPREGMGATAISAESEIGLARQVGRCFITSQNHGFAVNESTLQPGWEPWMRNANDDTNEGIRHKTKPFFSVQFHPEANPGPRDTAFLFDEFLKVIK